MDMRMAVAVLCVSAAVTTASAESLTVFIGTTMGRSSPSKGIYRCELNTETGILTDPVLVAEAASPSFLEIQPDGRFLYCIGGALGEPDMVSAFAIDPGTHELKLINRQPCGGSGPAFVSLDRTGTNLLVANYNSGGAAVLPITPDGSLRPATAVVQHEGSSVNKSRQAGPHAHSIITSPDNKFAYVPDLGIDRVMIYRFESKEGTLTANIPPFAQAAPGAGPRHATFHPNGRFLYIINELNGTVTGYSYDSGSGALTEIQTVSILPENFTGTNTSAEVRIHPNGRFLYGSNRGHNSIAVFQIDPGSGKLSFVEYETSNINTPRNFNLDPTGAFCIVANQNSNSLVVFRIDQATGALNPAGPMVLVGNPTCIRFLQSGGN